MGISRIPAKAEAGAPASPVLRAGELLHDMGYGATETVERLRELLVLCGPLNAEELARLVAMMAANYAGLFQAGDRDREREGRNVQAAWLSRDGESNGCTWNIHVVVQTIQMMVLGKCIFRWCCSCALMKEFLIQIPGVQWLDVFHRFDFPEFYIPDSYAFLFLLDFWRVAMTGAAFPLEILFSDYRNTRGHFSMLVAALGVPVETIDFMTTPRVQRALEGLPLPGLVCTSCEFFV